MTYDIMTMNQGSVSGVKIGAEDQSGWSMAPGRDEIRHPCLHDAARLAWCWGLFKHGRSICSGYTKLFVSFGYHRFGIMSKRASTGECLPRGMAASDRIHITLIDCTTACSYVAMMSVYGGPRTRSAIMI